MIVSIGLSCFDQFFFVPDYPRENRKLRSTAFKTSGGGPCGNAAYLLGLWQAPTYLVSVMANDMYGQQVLQEFAQVQVNTDYCLIDANQVTPLSAIFINGKNASRTIVTHKDQRERVLTPEFEGKLNQLAAKLNALPEEHLLLIDGHEPLISEYLYHRIDKKVVVQDGGNFNPGSIFCLGLADYPVASEHFAGDLIGVPSLVSDNPMQDHQNQLDALMALKSRGKPNAFPIVTLGEKGCVYLRELSAQEQADMPAYAVRSHAGKYYGLVEVPTFACTPVDSTGAGDIFHGAFVYGLNVGWPLERILDFAAMTAVLSIEKPGVRDTIPSLAQVQAALSSRSRNSTQFG